MPTLPVHQCCSASQETVSAPSSRSAACGTNTPAESNVPRQSWNTTAYPLRISLKKFGELAPNAPSISLP